MKDKAQALGVLSASAQKEDGEQEKHTKKLKPPDKDTMTVEVPIQHEYSKNMGPIWNKDADPSSGASQVLIIFPAQSLQQQQLAWLEMRVLSEVMTSSQHLQCVKVMRKSLSSRSRSAEGGSWHKGL